ncbi:putative AT-rich interactive domain-containing protein 5A [Hibiscus syriacus]|uniref:AT-rich interactive domain-containing protein 5A n=1 Tax=Hibiscus syriacus TaxID=106335 RepID=A0A6A3C1J7_HIBSY|nr:non-specific lipid transfer protein GPI-anchored 13-like [Hibiscus syriacus]KAE8721072.1 putative AT-rich interactive domain-containing protein 5A [Hibiscus syriacus]
MAVSQAVSAFIMQMFLVAGLFLSQSPMTPGQGPTVSDCSPRLVALVPCAPFVQGNAQRPAQSCCDNLDQLYGLQPACLCLLLNDTTLSAFPINRTLAVQLPILCKLQANTTVCSGLSQVSLGTNHTPVAASSPMVNPNVPAAPRPNIMGLGLGRSNAGRFKTHDDLLAVAVILVSKLALDAGFLV